MNQALHPPVRVEGRRFENPYWARVFAKHLAADQDRVINIMWEHPHAEVFDWVAPDTDMVLQS